ncbi:ABC transporter ATP-binding protein [Vibrio campbellii]|uniref:ABC transporter ATP-binding protein n=1 Tax=Vibrio campbellii TaxID=680 RepID=UPI000CD36F89|nr:ABC transporter ATP-binding protein [Vibrio campbellii]AUW04583.1 hypothetical protein C1N51_13130 [Vibrio campbellii]
MLYVYSILKDNQLKILFSLSILTMVSIIQLYIPDQIKKVADDFSVLLTYDFIIGSLILLLLLPVMTAMRMYFFGSLASEITLKIKTHIHDSIILKNESFFDSVNIAEVSSRINSDCDVIMDLVQSDIPILIRSIFLTIGSFIFISFISLEISIAFLILFPMFYFISSALGKRIKDTMSAYQTSLAKSNQVAFDNFNMHLMIKVHSFFDEAKYNYKISQDKSRKLYLENIKNLAYLQFFMILFSLSLVLLLSYIGYFLIQSATLTIGEFSAILLYLVMLVSNVGNLITFWSTLKQSVGSLEYLYEKILLGGDKEDHCCQCFDMNIEDISFENVSFRYSDKCNNEILKNLSFTIKKGEINLLVGASGTGKTTIKKIILGLYEQNEGHIYNGSKKITHQELIGLRGKISCVEQFPLFMSGSILDNLLLGLDSSNDYSIYKVIEACKKSEAHDFIINFPDGYQTQIGDRGTLLSGGQKQRLSIARALLKNTEFIILDEFTSAIDESTRDVISKNVIEIFKGKTILMITHDTRHFSLAKNIIEI